MNDGVKRKLYNLEVDPPGKMWSRISAALNDEVATEISSQLYDLEIKPPVKVWNSVAAALDNGEALNFPDKLYHLEVHPPIESWKKISNALDEEKALPRIPVKRKIPYIKYAVAASLLAMVGFGIKWLTAERTGPEIVQSSRTPKTQVQPKTESHQANPQTTNPTEEPKSVLTNNLPQEGPREAVAATTIAKSTTRRSGNYMTAAYKMPKPEFASSDGFCMANLKTDAPGLEPKFSEAAYRYIVFENDNCELVRISKKLAEKLGCTISDQNTVEYQNCIQQLRKWSEKIAQMNITPSADNFMNIFELLKSTEEKKF